MTRFDMIEYFHGYLKDWGVTESVCADCEEEFYGRHVDCSRDLAEFIADRLESDRLKMERA